MASNIPPSKFFLTLFLFLLAFLLLDRTESTSPRRAMISSAASVSSQFLGAHNRVRARHNLPSLKWSAGLAKYAKWYANKRRGDCALVHSRGDYGENIFWGQGSRWKAAEAVAAWAAQEAYYDYKSDRCMPNKECLHYTQLVWRKTVKVGCAKIKCSSGDAFVVCEYYPHGNVMGERPYN